MNPFKEGDKVRCKNLKRKNGRVVEIICGHCPRCNTKSYSLCETSVDKRYKVIATFPEDSGNGYKRFKYDYLELELDDQEADNKNNSVLTNKPPLADIRIDPIVDLSPKDIKALGTTALDVPLILSEEQELEVESESQIKNEDRTKPSLLGVSWDQYVGIVSMPRTI